MLTSNEIMAFIATADAEAAILFYRDRLGLRLVGDTEFALEFEAGELPTFLRIQKVEAVTAAPYTALGWKVEKIAEEVEALGKRGIVFERFDGLEQDENGIWTSPSGALIAWFKDPDGNVLSLTQLQPTTAPSAGGAPIPAQ
jgi:catechol 2,3-dioxygenase-like lactoylglutathione lyase family enzyme